MKIFIVLTSLLAATYANYPHYPINIPVIGKTGVPLEGPEIIHARHAHLAQVAAVKAQQHGGYYGGYDGYANAGYNGGYAGHYALPLISHNGVPLDTPEVQAAKAAHFATYAKAAAANGAYGGHYRRKRSVYGYAAPIIGHNGVPVETPEVQAAKAEHFAAHAKAGGLAGYNAGYNTGYNTGFGGYNSGLSSGYGYAQVNHDGVPLETPEVALLKAKHLEAHAEARSRIGPIGNNYGYESGAYQQGGYESGAYQQGPKEYQGAYTNAGYGKYHGPIHIPVIGHGGVPVETPEVQAAKAKHLAALAEASSRGGYEKGIY